MTYLLDVVPLATESLTWAGQAVPRLAVACLLGGLIGLEREIHGRSAGFRTQLLVALGSALAMVVSLNFAEVYGQSTSQAIKVDPARIAYGIMSGIGFLGAGAILRYGIGVRGMTTAASLWCTAAVGLACGFGMFIIAASATAMVILALTLLNKIDRFIPTRLYKSITVSLPIGEQDQASKLKKALEDQGVHIIDMEYERNTEQSVETITFHVSVPSRAHPLTVLSLVKYLPDSAKFSIR